MKKEDLKKLALLGLAGGALISSGSAYAEADHSFNGNDYSNYLAGHSCGGSGGGCGGSSSGSGYDNSNQRPSGGCNHRSQPRNWNNQAQNSCSSPQQGNWNNQAQSSCKSSQQANWNPQPQSSCKGNQQNRWSNTSQNQNNWQNSSYADEAGNTRPTPGNPTLPNDDLKNSKDKWSDRPHSNMDKMAMENDPANQMNDIRDKNKKPQGQRQIPYYNEDSSIADADRNDKHAHMAMKENELMGQLNAQGKASFQSMSTEGKTLALKVANGTCKGNNECKGLNSCSGNNHDCAGKGGCKGTGNGNFKDKNVAVKLVAAKMAEKRATATQPAPHM